MTPASKTISTDSGRKNAVKIPQPNAITPIPTVFVTVIISIILSSLLYASKGEKVSFFSSFHILIRGEFMKKEKKDEISLPFREQRITGKMENESCIAYSISLPTLPWEDLKEDSFFADLSGAFLHFLETKSREKREGVYFGGISYKTSGQKVFLSAAFSPFEERVFFPIATLFFSEKGDLEKITKPQRKREV